MDAVTLGMAKADAKKNYAKADRPTASITSARALALGSTFDSRTGLCNFKASHLAKTRGKIARAAAGLGPAKIAHVGDSITNGNQVDKFSQSYPARVRAALGALYPSGGTGYVPGAFDSRWTFGAGWTLQTATNFNYQCTTNGSTATFVSDVPGTIVTLTYRNTGALTVSIDGAAPVAVAASSSNTLKTYQVTGLADTVHTVVVTNNSNFGYICGIEVSRVNGLSVSNFGLSGSKTIDWLLAGVTADYMAPIAQLKAWAPDLVTVMLGTNDHRSGSVSAATYKTNLTTLVADLKATGIEVVLITPPPNDAGSSAIAPYLDALYDVALTQDVPVLDVHDRWRSYSSTAALGLMSEGTHPNAAGYDDLATAVLAAIVPGRPAQVAWAGIVGKPATFNAKDYGAAGNGTTDDTVAIAKAYAAAHAAGATLYLPAGTYKVTALPAFLDQDSIIGDGAWATKIVYAGTGTLLTLTGKQFVSFRDLQIWITGAGATAIDLSGCFRCSFTNVIIRGNHTGANTTYQGQTGIKLRDNTGGTTFQNCDIQNLGYGIQTSCIQNYVVNSKFTVCWRSVRGIGGTANAGMVFTNTEFTGGDTTQATETHILIDGSANSWSFTGCWFEKADYGAKVGVAGSGGPSQFSMVGCKIGARVVHLQLNDCRQPHLDSVEFDVDQTGTPTELVINATYCAEGVAINLVTTVRSDFAIADFPAYWFIVRKGQIHAGSIHLNGMGDSSDSVATNKGYVDWKSSWANISGKPTGALTYSKTTAETAPTLAGIGTAIAQIRARLVALGVTDSTT